MSSKNLRSYWNIIYSWINSFKAFKPTIYTIKGLYAQKNKKKSILFYSNFIKKGDLCFDIGAHIGNKTEIFLELGCNVVAVEPQKECFKFMKKKFSKNKNIIIINKAIGEKNGIKPLFICNANALSSMSKKWISAVKKGKRYSSFKWKEAYKIRTITLDELIKKYGKPKYCKIDVEGYELNVLKGLSQKIPYISIEFNVESINSTKKCIHYLNKLSRVLFNYTIKVSSNLQLKKWISKKEMLKILESTLKKTSWGDIYAKFI